MDVVNPVFCRRIEDSLPQHERQMEATQRRMEAMEVEEAVRLDAAMAKFQRDRQVLQEMPVCEHVAHGDRDPGSDDGANLEARAAVARKVVHQTRASKRVCSGWVYVRVQNHQPARESPLPRSDN